MYTIYQVMMGDTIEGIANKFNTDVNTIMKLNDINNIVPGYSIVVPKTNSYLTQYIVKEGDTIYAISRKNNVSKDVLLTLNGLNEYDYIYPNEQILIPMEGVEIYVTRDNDTLNNILNTIGITANELVKQNDKLFLLPDQLVVYKKEKSF